jgi:hypothetical protein
MVKHLENACDSNAMNPELLLVFVVDEKTVDLGD